MRKPLPEPATADLKHPPSHTSPSSLASQPVAVKDEAHIAPDTPSAVAASTYSSSTSTSTSSADLASSNSSNMATLAPAPAPQDVSMHGPTELPRPYKCPMCDKAFHRLEHQTRHIRTHTGEKPHACTFAGCHKRFSRSDELTRHSRIHTNVNPRRSYKASAHAAAHATPASAGAAGSAAAGGDERIKFSKSAPTSQAASPDVSPPHAHAQLASRSGVSSAYQSGASTPLTSGSATPLPFDMHMLATAASQQLERENSLHSAHSRSSLSLLSAASASSSAASLHHHHHHHHANSRMFPGLTPLTPFNAPTSTVRPHEDDAFGPRQHKRSRPNSPVSTAPSSPAYSTSESPTPEHTPLVTPAHSPRIHPRELEALQGVQLPSIRSLSLRHMPPPLVPLEVDTSASGSVSRSTSGSNLRLLPIAEILANSPGSMPHPSDLGKRLLPPPTSAPSTTTNRLSVADLINGPPSTTSSSTVSSTASSTAGEEARW
ncbi:uncharacterized protein V1518DRAFT_418516 [Limtongia smithiae]|uniref:uncharacterized protein n=1 Tax=Limtongia smithiae TaxID=1125753 RepID=UPI0034CDAA82